MRFLQTPSTFHQQGKLIFAFFSASALTPLASPTMLLPLALSLLTLPFASAITISPLSKGSNRDRLARGLGPLKPSRVWTSNNRRQAAAPAPSNGLVLAPHDIQGPTFLSSYAGRNVTNLQGVVTAKG